MTSAGFFKRFLAFIIDMIIISIISTIIYSSLNAIFNFKTTITESYTKSVEQTINKINEIDRDNPKDEDLDEAYGMISELSKLSRDNYKDITIEGVPNSLITFVINVLYFVVLVFYLGGHTLGKKLLNIRVVKENGSPVTINTLLIRGIIIYSLYSTVINLLFVFILNNESFFKLHSILSGISFIILFISGIMVIFNNDKRGLHDLISKTKVVIDE